MNFRVLYDFPKETPLTRGALKVCYRDGANLTAVAWVESMCVCTYVTPHTMCFSSVSQEADLSSCHVYSSGVI